jgi:hypothetical protein
MPDAAKLLETIVIAAVLAGALLGPPPAQPRRGVAVAVAASGVSIYVLALMAALVGHGAAGTLLVAPGVAVLALAGWLSRGADDGGDKDDDLPEPDAPVDWDEFDRLRDEWSRTGPRVLIGA